MVVPIYDEEATLPELHRRLRSSLDQLRAEQDLDSEIIAVNDGSRDGSLVVLKGLAKADPTLRIVDLKKNRGQHEAVIAGFAVTRSRMVVTIDADLQNPPEEIPRIVELLSAGHDLVATRRARRLDSIRRRFVSRLANAITRILVRPYTSVPLHDVGCMLRGFRRELVEAILRESSQPGSPSPFIPALALRSARNICEVEVAHAPRAHGRSRYSTLGLIRLQARLMATLLSGPRKPRSA